jgi:hypothetical protein
MVELGTEDGPQDEGQDLTSACRGRIFRAEVMRGVPVRIRQAPSLRARDERLRRFARSSSSPAYCFRLNPPISLKAAVSTKMNEPAGQLSEAADQDSRCRKRNGLKAWPAVEAEGRLPPAKHRFRLDCLGQWTASRAGEGMESASRNRIHSPVAACGSGVACAADHVDGFEDDALRRVPRAISGVRSEELLSQTMTSDGPAALMERIRVPDAGLGRVDGRSCSSLNAGMTTESVMWATSWERAGLQSNAPVCMVRGRLLWAEGGRRRVLGTRGTASSGGFVMNSRNMDLQGTCTIGSIYRGNSGKSVDAHGRGVNRVCLFAEYWFEASHHDMSTADNAAVFAKGLDGIIAAHTRLSDVRGDMSGN